ncbi:MAG: outer membrane protein transport protein [Gemmatimonadota bacterium]
MRRFHVWLAVGGLAALTGVPVTLAAQGFSVNEHSTCAMGRAGTAVASPCADGSAIFFNPAGVASSAKGHTTISAGGTAIAPSGGFTDDATGTTSNLNNKVYPIPALYITHGFSDRVAAGIGVFAPYGLTTDWPATTPGRYLGYKSVIRAIYIQPTVAVKLGSMVKLGAGFDLNIFHVQLRQRVDLSTQQLPAPAPPGATFANLGIPAGTDFADVNLTGNATGVGYNLGAILEPSDKVSLGLRFLSRQKVKMNNGTAAISQVSTGITLAAGNPFGVPAGTPLDAVVAGQFTGSGPLQDQNARTAVRMPEQLVGGIMVKPVDRLKLLFDVSWTNWKVFDTLSIITANLPQSNIPENFGATTAWRYGAEYEISPTTVIRAGYLFHNAAEPKGSVTPNLPEGSRSEFTVGLGAKLGSSLHGDLAYQYINQQDRRGRTVPFGQPDNGLFTFKAHLFGAMLTYTF